MWKINMSIRGYKVFNYDWTCRDKQYTCPGRFKENVELTVCRAGMHFCKNAADCFNYYKFDPNNKVAEVVAYGVVLENGNKCCTDKLEIVREIPWAEVLDIVNIGKRCTGFCNSGNWNSGDYNSGNWNSGDWNKTNYSNGCFNTQEPKIYLFNKLSGWTYKDWIDSEARRLLNQICPNDNIEYVTFSSMTDAEKDAHPEAKITGGYLKKTACSEQRLMWWHGLTDKEKSIIKAKPNFDAALFKEITGIDTNDN